MPVGVPQGGYEIVCVQCVLSVIHSAAFARIGPSGPWRLPISALDENGNSSPPWEICVEQLLLAPSPIPLAFHSTYARLTRQENEKKNNLLQQQLDTNTNEQWYTRCQQILSKGIVTCDALPEGVSSAPTLYVIFCELAALAMEIAKSNLVKTSLDLHCPNCSVAFYHDSGCNAMTCSHCGVAFCAVCLTSKGQFKTKNITIGACCSSNNNNNRRCA